jgi:hypothetical protein
VKVDPLASMRCWAVDIELGGRIYEVPALPAADWWAVLAAPEPLGALLDLIPEETGDLEDRLLAGEISGDEMTTALTDALEEVIGRPLRAGVVLAEVARAHWPVVNGRLAQRGFRWDVMPIGAALDAIYAMVMESQDEKGRTQFEAILDPEAHKQDVKAKARAAFQDLAGPRPTVRKPLRSSAAPSGDTSPKTPTRRRPPRQAGRSAVPN